MSAKCACNLGLDFLGMTGKFHTTWGEFGGHKHPNALRYECAEMLAFNSKCSVGDQLHPSGELDETTYRTIGSAYSEVAVKEPWCVAAEPVSDIGVLSAEAETGSHRQSAPDEGAVRALLEGHFLFELLDREMDFSRFKLLILPDVIRIDAPLKARIDEYLDRGGRLLLTGESGLWKDRSEFAFDTGADCTGLSEYSPDFILPAPAFRADFVSTPVVIYVRSQRIQVTTGESLGPDATLTTNLPSTARVSLNFRKSAGRHVLHLLFANTVSRGGAMDLAGGTVSGSGLNIEAIEELLPLRNTRVSIQGMPALKRVTLEPGGTEIPFARSGGKIGFSIDEFTCHQIVVLEDNG